MFALLLDANTYVNTINTWVEPHNANGVTPNSIIDSNDENDPACILSGRRNVFRLRASVVHIRWFAVYARSSFIHSDK